MAVVANVSSPSSYNGCLHAVSLSCYNNALWMGVSNCSLWRIELPLVDDVDVSRDSLAEISMKPRVSCELWSGISNPPSPRSAVSCFHIALCGYLTVLLALPGSHTMTTLSSSSPSAAASAAASVVTLCSSGCIYLWNTGTTLPSPLLVLNDISLFSFQRVMLPNWLLPAI
jgi:hypothetical protein